MDVFLIFKTFLKKNDFLNLVTMRGKLGCTNLQHQLLFLIANGKSKVQTTYCFQKQGKRLLPQYTHQYCPLKQQQVHHLYCK